MNIAGPIARGIFALTVVTIVGAVVSYALFKARDRRRRDKQRGDGEPKLMFFVEYRVAPIARAVPVPRRWWPGVTARLTTALLLLGGSAAGVVFVLGRGGELGADRRNGARSTGAARAIHTLTRTSRPPSLFPSAELDLDGNGAIGVKERELVHMVPQFVFITSDDNGSADGLRWIQDQVRARGFEGALTFFDTANYLPERPNFMGGPIEALWQDQIAESYVGIHGTTHESGGERWPEDHWRSEQATALDEIVHRLLPPAGSSWERYPFGSRAPFLSVDDAYFAALDKLAPAVVYDSSMVATPQGDETVDVTAEARDLPWPFTLDHPLPPEVQTLPDTVQHLAPHHLWEVPLPSWRLPGIGKPTWIISLDLELFASLPCDDVVDQRAVDAVLANLDAHYRGNRAPFHLGLHAQTYGAGSACQRATIAAILDGIDKRCAEGMDIQPISIPDLIAWLSRKSQVREGNKI